MVTDRMLHCQQPGKARALAAVRGRHGNRQINLIKTSLLGRAPRHLLPLVPPDENEVTGTNQKPLPRDGEGRFRPERKRRDLPSRRPCSRGACPGSSLHGRVGANLRAVRTGGLRGASLRPITVRGPVAPLVTPTIAFCRRSRAAAEVGPALPRSPAPLSGTSRAVVRRAWAAASGTAGAPGMLPLKT